MADTKEAILKARIEHERAVMAYLKALNCGNSTSIVRTWERVVATRDAVERLTPEEKAEPRMQPTRKVIVDDEK